MKFKRLIPALAMLLVSAILLGTSTFAWFSMNTTVTAANMQVKAVADQGILINEVAALNNQYWDNQATNTYGDGMAPIKLHATSTADTATWYTAFSSKQDSAAAAAAGDASDDLVDGYKTLGSTTGYVGTLQQITAASAGSTAKQDVYYVDKGGETGYDNGEGYYAKFTYYLKSSAGAITTTTAANGQNLNIDVNVTGNTATADLDESLRAAVVIDGKAYFFAPLKSTDASYYVNASSTATVAYKDAQPTAALTIPATDDASGNGLPVYVYLYFEGEDTNLKTTNVVNELDNLTVSIDFSLVTNGASGVTAHPVTVPTV